MFKPSPDVGPSDGQIDVYEAIALAERDGYGPELSLPPQPQFLAAEGGLVHNQRGFVRAFDPAREKRRRENRRRLWAAQRSQVSISRSLFRLDDPRSPLLKRYGLCRRFPRSELVTVRQRDDRCHFGDLCYCGSPWCIGCGSKIAEVRALEFGAAAARVVAAGGLVGFSTWTFGHGADDDLVELLVLLQGAMSYVDRVQKVIAARQGVRWHDVRRLDATHGWRNGFHPHRHVVTFYRPGTTPQQAAELDRLEFEYFSRWLAKRGRQASYDKGHDFQLVASHNAAEEVVTYLCKEALRELTYTHSKWGRGDNRSMAQVLTDFYDTGVVDDRDAWIEWAIAMRGKRSIRPSVGLRDELIPEIPTLTDEQAAQDDDGLALVLTAISRAEWNDVWRSQLGPAGVLEAAESAVADGATIDAAYFWRRLETIVAA
jgi:hypothetical protein